MRVGITLPAMIPGTPGDQALTWARKADEGPFSSLAIGERLLWPGYDVMVTLAAAAAVTNRVRLVSTIVVMPLHSAIVVAKQAATIDVISNGRVTLGVGIGGRDDDFRAVGASFENRHAHMEEQVAAMRRLWRGEPALPGLDSVGPLPVQKGGPEVLVGSIFPAAVKRVARWADGLSAWSFEPNAAALRETFRLMEDAWRAAGRAGRPRLVAGFWYALGPGAEATLRTYVAKYLGYFGVEVALMTAHSVRTTNVNAVRDALRSFADAGVDEAIPVPVSADIDQLDRLADLVG